MSKFTAKKLHAYVTELNQTTLNDLPWGFRLDEDKLLVVRRKGGDNEVICRGTTYELRRAIEVVLATQTRRVHDIIDPRSEP